MAKARLAQNQIARDPAKAQATLVEVQADAKGALANLRELAQGIAPPLLVDRGLVVAVGSRLSRLPIDAKLDVGGDAGDRRFPAAAEGAAWFVVSEALANALKHAGASSAVVSIDSDRDELRIEVTDDGCGINGAEGRGTGITGMADRVGAVGGRLEVVVALPRGTAVRAQIPVGPR